jgi:hypothetical protein
MTDRQATMTRNMTRQRIVLHALQIARLQTMNCSHDINGNTVRHHASDVPRQIAYNRDQLEMESHFLLSALSIDGERDEPEPPVTTTGPLDQ